MPCNPDAVGIRCGSTESNPRGPYAALRLSRERRPEPMDADVSHHELLRTAMAQLSDNIAEPGDIDSLLRTVTTTVIELLDQVHAADVLLVDGNEFRSVAATSPLPLRLDAVQQRLRQGPCWDAATTTSNPVTVCNDLRTDTRWPEFSTAAVAENVHSMLSFRLYTHNHRVGALNLFALETDAFDYDAETIGAMLATNAAAALISHDRGLQFQSALHSRDIVGQAKGMIMERFAVDATRAFELLTKLSQDTNISLARVAADIVAHGPESR